MADRIVILDGHPDPDEGRLCHALAGAYEVGASEAGHEVRRIEIGKLEFPLLRSQAEFEDGTVPDDIKQAQDDIVWASHLLIVYPLWLGTMPALLKAFLEHAIRPGFAFEAGSKGWPAKLLQGRTARIVITMGMPGLFYRWFYLAHSLRSLERNILKFVGVKPIGETVLGMVEYADEAKRARWLSEMTQLGRRAR